MKLNGKDRIISTDDVEITSGKYIGKTITDAIDEQKSKLDKLESNVKWIYKYGGVGSGTGSGNGSGGTTKSFSLYATIDGSQIKENGQIMLNGAGQYAVMVRVVNPSATSYRAQLAWYTADGTKQTKSFTLTIANEVDIYVYAVETYINFNTNSSISVTLTDGNEVKQTTCSYIVEPYAFVPGMINDENEYYTSDDNDIYISDAVANGLYASLKYTIYVSAQVNYTITTQIQGQNIKQTGTISNKSGFIKYPFPEEYLSEEYSSYYNVQFNLTVIPDSGKETTLVYNVGFSIIPSELYLKVTPATGVIYQLPQKFVYTNDDGDDEESYTLPEGKEDKSSWYQFATGYVSFNLKVYDGIKSPVTWTIQRTLSKYDPVTDVETSMLNATTTYQVLEQETQIDSGCYVSETGWYKLTYNIDNGRKYSTYYFYVVSESSDLDWYSMTTVQTGALLTPVATNYYRVSECTSAFDKYINTLSTSYISMRSNSSETPICSTTTNSPLELPKATSDLDLHIAIGIQYSLINDTDQPILRFSDAYSNHIDIYQDHVMLNTESIDIYLNKIDGADFGPVNQSQYHLLDIVYRKVGVVSSKTQYEFVIYLDGVLEGMLAQFQTSIIQVQNLIMYPGNYYINLLEVSYWNTDYLKDVDIVQYWYKYNAKLLSNFMQDKVNSLRYFRQVSFTDDNHVLITNEDAMKNMCINQEIPTLIIQCQDKNASENWLTFIDTRYQQSGTETKAKIPVSLQWAKAGSAPEDVVTGNTSQFYIQLQGSSSYIYRAKNFTLSIEDTTGDTADTAAVPVFSPNFDPEDTTTFLPEQAFTLKADVVDSSHSNNTSIGSFVNRASTKFDTGETSKYKGYIKNCLEGFPCYVVFAYTPYGSSEVQYYIFGIYNFNLGRQSYFNLGYIDTAILTNGLSSVQDAGFIITTIQKGDNKIKTNFIVAEIQAGSPYYDFSEYDSTILFPQTEDDENYMWGDTVMGNSQTYESKIQMFTKKIAKAGGYLFSYIGKRFGEHEDQYHATFEDGTPCNQVPNYRQQYTRVDNTYTKKSTLEAAATEDDLEIAVIDDAERDITDNKIAALNLQSAVEYYVICMAFGLVDSVQKNLNIKTWDGAKFYTAFYDMDTCLGIDNAGYDVAYFAFSDYWTTQADGQIVVYRDYYPHKNVDDASDTTPIGYDIPSSYLFAVAKYATLLIDSDEYPYPAQIWANYRQGASKGGLLQDADYFIDKFYKNHLSDVSEMAFNLNYRFKYFVPASDTSATSYHGTEAPKFHGRRIEKVRNWLKGRFHLLDAYFNLAGASIPMQYVNDDNQWVDYYVGAKALTEIKPQNVDLNNDDIYIIGNMFSTGNAAVQYTARTINPTIQVQDLTPMVIVNQGVQYYRYLFKDANTDYTFKVVATGNNAIKFGGSKMWVKLDSINGFIMPQFYADNDYIDTIVGTAGECSTWTFNLPSLKSLTLTSQYYSGALSFTSSQANLTYIDISNTKITLEVKESYVQTIYANRITAAQMTISSCNSLQHMRLAGSTISTLTISPSCNTELTIDSDGALTEKDENNNDVSLITDTYWPGLQVQTFTIVGPTVAEGKTNNNKLVIKNDPTLTSLKFSNYSYVMIQNCPNLKTINISDVDTLRTFIVKECGGKLDETETFTIYDRDSSNTNTINLCNQTALEEFSITNQLKVEKVMLTAGTVLGTEALKGCQNIRYIDVYKTTTVTNEDGTTTTTTALTSDNADGLVINGESVFDGLYNYGRKMSDGNYTPLVISADCTSLKNLFAASSYYPNKLIDTAIMKDIINLIPAENKIANVSGMFRYCINISYAPAECAKDYNNKRFMTTTKSQSLFKNLYAVTDASYMFEGCEFQACNPYMFKHADGWDDALQFSNSVLEKDEDGNVISGNFGLGARAQYINLDSMLTGLCNDNGKYTVAYPVDAMYPIITKGGRYHTAMFAGTGTSLGKSAQGQVYNSVIKGYNFWDTTSAKSVYGLSEADPINLLDLFRYKYTYTDGEGVQQTKEYYTTINNIDYMEFSSQDYYINFGAATKDVIEGDSASQPVFCAEWSGITRFMHVLALGYSHFMNYEYMLYNMPQFTYMFDSFTRTTSGGYDAFHMVNWSSLLSSIKNYSDNTTSESMESGLLQRTYGTYTKYFNMFSGTHYITYDEYREIISLMLNSETLEGVQGLFNDMIVFVPFNLEQAASERFNNVAGLCIDERLGNIVDADGNVTKELTYPINVNIKDATQMFDNIRLFYSENGEYSETSLSDEATYSIPLMLADNFLNVLPSLTIVTGMFQNNRFYSCIPYNIFQKRYLAVNGADVYYIPETDGIKSTTTYYEGKLYIYSYRHEITNMECAFMNTTLYYDEDSKDLSNRYFTQNTEQLLGGYPVSGDSAVYINQKGVTTIKSTSVDYTSYTQYSADQLDSAGDAISHVNLMYKHTLESGSDVVVEYDSAENLQPDNFVIMAKNASTPTALAAPGNDGSQYDWSSHTSIALDQYRYEVSDAYDVQNTFSLSVSSAMTEFMEASSDTNITQVKDLYINNQTMGAYTYDPLSNNVLWDNNKSRSEAYYSASIPQYSSFGIKTVTSTAANSATGQFEYSSDDMDVIYVNNIKRHLAFAPDIFYGCTTTAAIHGAMANTDFTGIMPEHAVAHFHWDNQQMMVSTFKNMCLVPRYVNTEYEYRWTVTNFTDLQSLGTVGLKIAENKGEVSGVSEVSVTQANGIYTMTFKSDDFTVTYNDEVYNIGDAIPGIEIDIVFNKHYTFIPNNFMYADMAEASGEYMFNFLMTLPTAYKNQRATVYQWFSVIMDDSMPKRVKSLYCAFPTNVPGTTLTLTGAEDSEYTEKQYYSNYGYWGNGPAEIRVTLAYSKADDTDYRYAIDMSKYTTAAANIQMYDSLSGLAPSALTSYLHGPIFNKAFDPSLYTWNTAFLYASGCEFSHYLILPHITKQTSGMISASATRDGDDFAYMAWVQSDQYVDTSDQITYAKVYDYNNDNNSKFWFGEKPSA